MTKDEQYCSAVERGEIPFSVRYINRHPTLHKGYAHFLFDLGLKFTIDLWRRLYSVERLSEALAWLMESLTVREQLVCKLRYVEYRSLESIGEECGVCSTRVKQILIKVMRKVKHPSRYWQLFEGTEFGESLRKKKDANLCIRECIFLASAYGIDFVAHDTYRYSSSCGVDLIGVTSKTMMQLPSQFKTSIKTAYVADFSSVPKEACDDVFKRWKEAFGVPHPADTEVAS